MPTHRVVPMLALLLALFAAPAWAFLDPPYITPANPTVGDLISVNVYGGECDLLDYGSVAHFLKLCGGLRCQIPSSMTRSLRELR